MRRINEQDVVVLELLKERRIEGFDAVANQLREPETLQPGRGVRLDADVLGMVALGTIEVQRGFRQKG